MAKDFSITLYRSKAWRQCREGYISSVDGLCERCMKRGILTPGLILHHKIVLTPRNINDHAVTLNWDNLEYQCQECHNQTHGSNKAVTAEGLSFDSDGQLIEV